MSHPSDSNPRSINLWFNYGTSRQPIYPAPTADEPKRGIEPPTYALQERCSTVELLRR